MIRYPPFAETSPVALTLLALGALMMAVPLPQEKAMSDQQKPGISPELAALIKAEGATSDPPGMITGIVGTGPDFPEGGIGPGAEKPDTSK